MGIDYNKILEKIIEEFPHNIDKIKKVINDASKNSENNVNIDFERIIKSRV